MRCVRFRYKGFFVDERDICTGSIWQLEAKLGQSCPLPAISVTRGGGVPARSSQSRREAQGLSLDCTVCCGIKRDFSTGLQPVAVSRMRASRGMPFHSSSDLDKLCSEEVSANIKTCLQDQESQLP